MFLTNHTKVLICLAHRPDATLREISDRLDLTERAIYRIVKELVEARVLKRYREGRRNRYEIRGDAPLGSGIDPDCSVGDLIRVTAGNNGNGVRSEGENARSW